MPDPGIHKATIIQRNIQRQVFQWIHERHQEDGRY